MALFGQVVIGPPGSGKTTYCASVSDTLSSIGRDVIVVNVDPANENLPYKCGVDIRDLITLPDVMENLKLGPNGGMIYCLEYLEQNLDWLKSQLDLYKKAYFLFDCPGQVELYTHHNSIRNIFAQLTKWDFRLVAVHLVDSHYCSDSAKFISVLLTSLSTMLQVELPHINVLSKIDLVEQYGKLAFNFDYYTEVLDLNYILDSLQKDPFMAKFKKFNEAVCGIIEDYSLVSFSALNIQNKESVFRLLKKVDQANGYVYGGLEDRNPLSILSTITSAEYEETEAIADVREQYMNVDDDTE